MRSFDSSTDLPYPRPRRPDGRIEEQYAAARRCRCPSFNHRCREERAGPIEPAIVELYIREVAVLNGHHALLAQPDVQLDALFVEVPRLGIRAAHPDRNRLHVDRHPLEPGLARPASQRARLPGQGAHVLEFAAAQRDPRQQAQRVDLGTNVSVLARPAQQLQRKLLRPARLPRPKGGERIFVDPHQSYREDRAGRRIIPIVATALSLTHIGSLMRGVRSVDEVGADERAASLAKRSIKKSSKLWRSILQFAAWT